MILCLILLFFIMFIVAMSMAINLDKLKSKSSSTVNKMFWKIMEREQS